MRAAIFALLLAGCYSPSTPSGAYTCGANNGCPSNQTCVCGLCVTNPADAVCALTVDVGSAPISIAEHATFPVTITAQNANGSTSAGYNGTVALSFELPDHSTWCDVSPAQVQLQNGTATVNVSLNRETTPPQQPALTARFLSVSGSAATITVVAPPLTRDTNPVVAPLSGGSTFGWGHGAVFTPNVSKSGGAYTMYFGSNITPAAGTSIGVASSTDGINFTPTSAPIIPGDANHLYTMPSMYAAPDGIAVLVSDAPSADVMRDGATIARSVSPDGKTGFSKPTPRVVDCANLRYCIGKQAFPYVLPDPNLTPADGGVPMGWLAYFAGASPQPRPLTGDPPEIFSIGLATSSDGKTFLPEPAAVLNGDLGGESQLLAPVVWLDGHVYKMLYSFARSRDSGAAMCKLSIGYATSSDGRYWVRSPSNSPTAPIEGPTTGTGWDAADVGFLAGSVVGEDSQSIALYYTVYREVTTLLGPACIPNGIGRATRP
jgi:hypothetical protein